MKNKSNLTIGLIISLILAILAGKIYIIILVVRALKKYLSG